MAGMKEIKNKIEGIQETQKITSAMYLIASTKLRKAREHLDQTMPYFEALKNEIAVMFSNIETVKSRYFLPEGVAEDEDTQIDGRHAWLVITADKALAGEYNQRVIRRAENLLSQHEDNALFVVGENGRAYFSSHGYQIEKSFLYSAQNPDMNRARDICEHLIDQYNDGTFSKIYLVYTDFGGGVNPQCVVKRLLPLHRAFFDEIPGTSENDYEFIPSADEVLDNIIPNFLIGYVYSALVDSYCSEQNARMVAMDNANRNAGEMLDQLRLQYNHARQGTITQEITEVVSGARAMRRK
ncbi:MAG: ATP synthase F1 subunit gamma [Parasporobacterium sp.]|nr:ATP synthase F1 subunit gamma [Parasporobacterium sp.]